MPFLIADDAMVMRDTIKCLLEEHGFGDGEPALHLATAEVVGMYLVDGNMPKLDSRNRAVEAVNRENRKYLDGITQGLLLIDRAFRTGEQYSAFLTRLFPGAQIAGVSFVDFLLPDPGAQASERRELEKYPNIPCSSTMADEETPRDVNPVAERVFRVRGAGDVPRELVLGVGFRLTSAEGVENVMVIFDDRTAVAEAQRDPEEERHRRESELETVASILRTGPKALKELVEDSRAALVEATGSATKLGDPEVVKRVFRRLHGLEGSAASLGFAAVAELAHAAEEVLAGVRDQAVPPDADAARELEGRIAVSTAEAKGTRFTLTIPARQ